MWRTQADSQTLQDRDLQVRISPHTISLCGYVRVYGASLNLALRRKNEFEIKINPEPCTLLTIDRAN